eukprot:5162736-Pleurochrysis_carterae.AAC.1
MRAAAEGTGTTKMRARVSASASSQMRTPRLRPWRPAVAAQAVDLRLRFGMADAACGACVRFRRHAGRANSAVGASPHSRFLNPPLSPPATIPCQQSLLSPAQTRSLSPPRPPPPPPFLQAPHPTPLLLGYPDTSSSPHPFSDTP